jgi:hypothetical protein
MADKASQERIAARCLYLRTTLANGGDLLNICQHIVREGMTCVGPFLDDAETDCGLWEYKPRLLPPVRQQVER